MSTAIAPQSTTLAAPETPTLSPAAIPFRVFQFGGLEATETHLNLHPSLSDSQEHEIIGHIRTAGRGMPWWIGDYALYYQRKVETMQRLENDEAAREKRKPLRFATYDRTLAEAWSISAGHIRNAAALARLYPPHARRPALPWRAHLEAAVAIGWQEGRIREALAILSDAEKGGWSCADIRQKTLPHPSDSKPAADSEENPFAALDSADRFVVQAKERLADIDKDRATTLLVRFHALAEFVDRLRSLAGVTGANVVSQVRQNAQL
jgi:hypothetical protein